MLAAARVGGMVKVAAVDDPVTFAGALGEAVGAPAALEGVWPCPVGFTEGQAATLAQTALEPMRVADGWFDVSAPMLSGTMATVAQGIFPGAFRLVALRSAPEAMHLRRGPMPGRYDDDIVGAWSLPESVHPVSAVRHATDLISQGATAHDAARSVVDAAHDAERFAPRRWLVGVVVGIRGWVGATSDTASTLEHLHLLETLPARLVARELLVDGDGDLSWWAGHLRSSLACDHDGFFALPGADQMTQSPLTAGMLSRARVIHGRYVEQVVSRTVGVARAVDAEGDAA